MKLDVVVPVSISVPMVERELESRVPKSSRASWLVKVVANRRVCLQQGGRASIWVEADSPVCGILVHVVIHKNMARKTEREGRKE